MSTGILLSGGMDSIALSYWLKPDFAVTIDYGQKPASGEIRASSETARLLGIEFVLIRVDTHELGSGDLAGSEPSTCAPVSEWWPFRNQLLITLAVMKGIQLGIDRLMIGTVRTDSQHADGKPEFVGLVDSLVSFQEGGIRVSAPAAHMTTAELVAKSKVPIDVLALAHSCHVSEFACGLCRGCRKHYETMEEIGVGPY